MGEIVEKKSYTFDFGIGVKYDPRRFLYGELITVEAMTDYEAYARALTLIWNKINVEKETIRSVDLHDVTLNSALE